MKVFLGWSGSRSKETAEALGDWLGQVIQAVDPWISSDILKGARWGEEIADKLEEAKVGIICLTRENLDENWILFEAGALSKTKDAHVCTFLLDLKPSDIKQPLAMFQHTEFEKGDVRKLTHTINQTVEKSDGRSLDGKRLDTIFDRFWPDLEKQLKAIAVKTTKVSKPIRTDHEILEEILEILRKREMAKVKVVPTIPPEIEIEQSGLGSIAGILRARDRELSDLIEKGQLDERDAEVAILRSQIDELLVRIGDLLEESRGIRKDELDKIINLFVDSEKRYRQLEEQRSLS